MSNDMDKEQQALIITKALAYTENGGKPTKPKVGKSGEMKSIFQFTPATWKLYSKQVLGQEVPLTNETEAAVVHQKVSNWLDQGFKPEQIASMWNAGERKPDAYKQNWKGTNKYGVDYNTPAYAKKVVDYVKEFSNEGTTPTGTPGMIQNQPMPKTELAGKMPGLFGGNANVGSMPKDIGGLLKTATQNIQQG